MYVEGRKITWIGLVMRSNSKTVLHKIPVWPLAGSPDAGQPVFSWQEDTLPQLLLCSARCWPHPGQTWQVLIPQEFAAAARPVLCPSRPLRYLCKWGRALCKHCPSLCDRWALHTHLIQVRVNRANCVFYFACLLNCQIFSTDLAIFFLKLSRLLL